jgi:hypothetical protein
MIANDEQFVIVKDQVRRLESALESLARTIRPKSESQYRVFAEGYVDQLAILRNDINDYLGLTPVMHPAADIEVSVEGPHAALGDTRVSAVTKLIDRFRRALRTTVESVRDSLAIADQENLTEQFLDRLCDPPLQAVAPGSVKVQLASPNAAVGNELYSEGLDLLSMAILSVSGDAAAAKELRSLSADQQKAALTAAKILAPEKDDLASQIGLGGRFLGPQRHVQFDFGTRKRIQRQLSRIARQVSKETVRGVIREIDLDRRLFTLREPDTGLTVERCKYKKTLDEQMSLLVNDEVEVMGTRRSNALRATRLRVKTVMKVADV